MKINPYTLSSQMRFRKDPKLSRKRTPADAKPSKKRNNNRTSKKTEQNVSADNGLTDSNHNPLTVTSSTSATEKLSYSTRPTISMPSSPFVTEETRELCAQIARDVIMPGEDDVTSFSCVVGHGDFKAAVEDVAVLPEIYPELHRECGLQTNGRTGVM